MGEPRGKLEELVAELESKKESVERMLQEFDLILPHLQQSLAALDKAGFTDTESEEVEMPETPNIQEVPRPEKKESGEETAEAKKAAEEQGKKQEEEKAAEGAPAEEAPAEEAPAEGEGEGEESPARRSIASLVGGGE